jgi:hypothetical protein
MGLAKKIDENFWRFLKIYIINFEAFQSVFVLCSISCFENAIKSIKFQENDSLWLLLTYYLKVFKIFFLLSSRRL